MNLFVEKLFFKKRYVLSSDNYKNVVKPQIKDAFSVIVIKEITELKAYNISGIRNDNINKFVYNKNNLNSWFLYIIIDNKSRDVIGYYLAIKGTNCKNYHDSFFFEKESILLCMAYIDKNYRNLGLYKYLIYFVHSHLFSLNYKKIFTIVEKNNKKSLNANTKMGLKIYYTNYLIKIFSFNLFSIFLKNSSIEFIMLGKVFGNKIIHRKSERG